MPEGNPEGYSKPKSLFQRLMERRAAIDAGDPTGELAGRGEQPEGAARENAEAVKRETSNRSKKKAKRKAKR